MTIAETLTSGSNNKVSGTAITIGTDASRVSGVLVVVALAYDNLSATTPTCSFSTPGGETNAWTVVQCNCPQATAAAGVVTTLGFILTTVDWSAHSLGATLSGAVTAKGYAWKTFTGSSATVRGSAVTAPLAGSLTGQNMSSDAASVAGDLVLLAVGSEQPGDGTVPDWTSTDETINSKQSNGSTGGSGVTNATVTLAYAVQSVGGSRTYTFATETDGGGIVVSLAPPSAGGAVRALVNPRRYSAALSRGANY